MCSLFHYNYAPLKSFFIRLFLGLFFIAGLFVSIFLSVPEALAQAPNCNGVFCRRDGCLQTQRVYPECQPKCDQSEAGLTPCGPLTQSTPPAGGTPTSPAGTTGGWAEGSTAISQFGLPETSEDRIIVNLLQWLLLLFTFVSLIAFIISGLQYLLATGSETIIETAKRHMTWSLVGVIVGLSGWIIWQAVVRLLSGQQREIFLSTLNKNLCKAIVTFSTLSFLE